MMNVDVITIIAKAAIILTMLPTAAVEAWLIRTAFQTIARNPKLEETLFPKVIISVALVESTAIYALVAFFTL
jgi:F0F1-type ATP synthase membrane subunit c/vacuolar-type H+-ATPase subunit K